MNKRNRREDFINKPPYQVYWFLKPDDTIQSYRFARADAAERVVKLHKAGFVDIPDPFRAGAPLGGYKYAKISNGSVQFNGGNSSPVFNGEAQRVLPGEENPSAGDRPSGSTPLIARTIPSGKQDSGGEPQCKQHLSN